MSKKKQKKAKDERVNSHHILHYRRWWQKGYNKKLRQVFVFDIPVDVHAELHEKVGPVLPLQESEARWLWAEYQARDREFEDIFEALAWLQLHAPTPEFAMAIMAQAGFLRNHLGRS